MTETKKATSFVRLISRKLLRGMAYILVAVSVAGLVMHFMAFKSNPLLAVAAFSAYLLIAAPVALAVLGIQRDWFGVAVSGMVVVLSATLIVPRYIAADLPKAENTSLTVMTANLYLGQADAGAVVRLVREHHVDVLMLQELTPIERARLEAAGLDQVLPHNIVDARSGPEGTGLWSSYPMADQTNHPNFLFASVSARLVIGGKTDGPTVVATHIPGPYPNAPILWRRDIGRLPALLTSLAQSATTRGADVLVGGDFNATLDTTQFRRLLTNGYHDAGEQSGAGLARTYPDNKPYPPLIGIDHVLTRGAVAQRVETFTMPGSDHRSVISTIRLST